jgi:transcriptional regulator with XRE-family HTH domain
MVKLRTQSESALRDEVALLKALQYMRQEAGLSQSDVAARMGTQPSAVARLEQAMATGKHSPSVATLLRYVKACGKRLELKVI